LWSGSSPLDQDKAIAVDDKFNCLLEQMEAVEAKLKARRDNDLLDRVHGLPSVRFDRRS